MAGKTTGHHSTSDDSTRYRSVDEIEGWRANRHPINRLYKFMIGRQWWDESLDKTFKETERHLVLDALMVGEKKELPNWKESLFGDVYDSLPKNLQRQQDDLEGFIQRHPHMMDRDH